MASTYVLRRRSASCPNLAEEVRTDSGGEENNVVDIQTEGNIQRVGYCYIRVPTEIKQRVMKQGMMETEIGR